MQKNINICLGGTLSDLLISYNIMAPLIKLVDFLAFSAKKSKVIYIKKKKRLFRHF